MRHSVLFVLFGVLALTAFAPAQQAMPRIEGESLAEGKVVLPDAAHGHVAVLIFGFTKASKEATKAWGDKLLSEFGSQSGFEVYQLPVLEEVPRFIRGMVISGIKKGVKENLRDHFVPILHEEAELKKFVGYHEPDDAYLIVLNSSGQVVRQLHGSYKVATYASVRDELRGLLNRRALTVR